MTNNNPESQQECCERCLSYEGDGDPYGNGGTYEVCSIPDCPCHTPAPSQSVGIEPTSEDLVDPLFNAVWDAIKGWDLERERGAGYAGATGTDVMTILKVVRPFLTQKEQEVLEIIEGMKISNEVTVVGDYAISHQTTAYQAALSDLRDRITKSK